MCLRRLLTESSLFENMHGVSQGMTIEWGTSALRDMASLGRTQPPIPDKWARYAHHRAHPL